MWNKLSYLIMGPTYDLVYRNTVAKTVVYGASLLLPVVLLSCPWSLVPVLHAAASDNLAVLGMTRSPVTSFRGFLRGGQKAQTSNPFLESTMNPLTQTRAPSSAAPHNEEEEEVVARGGGRGVLIAEERGERAASATAKAFEENAAGYASPSLPASSSFRVLSSTNHTQNARRGRVSARDPDLLGAQHWKSSRMWQPAADGGAREDNLKERLRAGQERWGTGNNPPLSGTALPTVLPRQQANAEESPRASSAGAASLSAATSLEDLYAAIAPEMTRGRYNTTDATWSTSSPLHAALKDPEEELADLLESFKGDAGGPLEKLRPLQATAGPPGMIAGARRREGQSTSSDRASTPYLPFSMSSLALYPADGAGNATGGVEEPYGPSYYPADEEPSSSLTLSSGPEEYAYRLLRTGLLPAVTSAPKSTSEFRRWGTASDRLVGGFPSQEEEQQYSSGWLGGNPQDHQLLDTDQLPAYCRAGRQEDLPPECRKAAPTAAGLPLGAAHVRMPQFMTQEGGARAPPPLRPADPPPMNSAVTNPRYVDGSAPGGPQVDVKTELERLGYRGGLEMPPTRGLKTMATGVALGLMKVLTPPAAILLLGLGLLRYVRSKQARLHAAAEMMKQQRL